MVYLSLAILSSASIAIIFKYSENNNLNRYAVTSMNYVTAFIVSLVMIFTGRLLPVGREGYLGFFTEFTRVVGGGDGIFSNYSSVIWGTVLGIIAGAFFFLSFIYYQKSVRENGVGLAGNFAKLGILIPMALSIVVWRELPSIIQWIGIALSLASIIIINYTPGESIIENIKPNLILLFAYGGMADFSNKLFQRYAAIEYKNIFLFFVFFTAFLISLYFTLKSKKTIGRYDIMTGFLVGVPNLFSSYFLILALTEMTTSVVFPIYSAGTIVLINLSGFILFKEHLKTRELVSILMTLGALILINI